MSQNEEPASHSFGHRIPKRWDLTRESEKGLSRQERCHRSSWNIRAKVMKTFLGRPNRARGQSLTQSYYGILQRLFAWDHLLLKTQQNCCDNKCSRIKSAPLTLGSQCSAGPSRLQIGLAWSSKLHNYLEPQGKVIKCVTPSNYGQETSSLPIRMCGATLSCPRSSGRGRKACGKQSNGTEPAYAAPKSLHP